MKMITTRRLHNTAIQVAAVASFLCLVAYRVCAEPSANHGLLVLQLPENSALAKAGIKAGDILTQWGTAVEDQTELDSLNTWTRLVAGKSTTEEVPIVGVRKGEPYTFNVRPGNWTAKLRSTNHRIVVAESLTVVSSASRHEEPILEAPVAVTRLAAREIEHQASHGQLPKLLEHTPGVEVAQSGVYFFNLNTRGPNQALNRRILTLIDGRNLGTAVSGGQEWAAVAFPLDDIATIELIRGPGSALYGTDAFNGVLNIVTKAPRDSQGRRIRLALGELATRRLDLRYATDLGSQRYLKLLGNYTQSSDFTDSRTESVEYSQPCTETLPINCLPLEASSPVSDKNRLWNTNLRLDQYFGTRSLAIEIGTSHPDGVTILTSAGRFQLVDVDRYWGRVAYNTTNWRIRGNWGTRRQVANSLAAPIKAFFDEDRINLELTRTVPFAEDRGFAVGGFSYVHEAVDTSDPQGRQTLLISQQDADSIAAFGQVEYYLTDRLKGVVAARWDENSLHDSQLSPRGSLVYSFNPRHSVRFTYSRAFQKPIFSDFFAFLDVAPPLDLSPIEGICIAQGVSCGFPAVQLVAVGNENLQVEEVESLELGYSGVIGRNLFARLDVYWNEMDEFISELIEFNNSALGPINRSYSPYVPPSNLPKPAADILLSTLETSLPPALFNTLSNHPETGNPILTLLSFTNFAQAKSNGLELSLTYALRKNLSLEANYAYLDFEAEQQLSEDPIVPNSAKNRFSLSLNYVGKTLNSSFRFRHSEEFAWKSGVFRGLVPSYSVVDLSLNHQLSSRVELGLNVSNLFNNRHYEIFGGDLLERRALLHVLFSW